MVEKERDTSGRYSRSVDDTDVVAAVQAHDPAATSEIAEAVGITRQGADRRLRDLRERGEVSSKKIGASLVWFTPRERGQQTPRESPESPPEPEPDRNLPDTPAVTSRGEDGRPFDHDSLPSGIEPTEAADAYHAVVEYLTEDGPAGMREIVTEVMPDHPLGYDAPELEPGDRYRGAWWRKVIQPSLKADAAVTYRENHADYEVAREDDD